MDELRGISLCDRFLWLVELQLYCWDFFLWLDKACIDQDNNLLVFSLATGAACRAGGAIASRAAWHWYRREPPCRLEVACIGQENSADGLAFS